MNKPDFFIAGAPKSGTTSLCEYLAQHPQIFISNPKEPDFFGQDLIRPDRYRPIEDYLALFDQAGNRICGEGSTIYFISTSAPEEIYALNPDAKIIIMLREPVSLLYSLHSQLVFDLHEDITDFQEAISAENDRRLGKRIPKRCRRLNWLFYSDVVKFSENIQRYYDIFGKENVKIIIFDDFKENVARVYQEVLNFLEVDSIFQANFEIHNSAKQIRNLAAYTFFRDPPDWLFKIGNKVTPPFLRNFRRQVAWGVINKVKQYLAPNKSRPGLDPDLELQLKQQFAPEVEKLSALINQDLSHWLKGTSNQMTIVK